VSDQNAETHAGDWAARLRQIGAERIALPIGSRRSVSWLTLQAVLFFVGCVICSCCSITSFVWGNESFQITLPAPAHTATITPTARDVENPLNNPEPSIGKPPKPTRAAETVGTETPPPETAPPATSTPDQSPLSTPLATSPLTPSPPPEPTKSSLTPPPTNPPDSSFDLHIVLVEYSRPGRDWTEEHVLIENRGAANLNLTGWKLGHDESGAYEFPAGFVLDSGRSVRVWSTKGVDTEIELYWGREEAAWPPEDGIVHLWDASGAVVDRHKW